MFEEIPKNYRYGYIRVSSQSQEENSSLESQKKELLKTIGHRSLNATLGYVAQMGDEEHQNRISSIY